MVICGVVKPFELSLDRQAFPSDSKQWLARTAYCAIVRARHSIAGRVKCFSIVAHVRKLENGKCVC